MLGWGATPAPGRPGRRAILGAAGGLVGAAPGRAQTNVLDRPIRMIVPGGAGTGADLVARAVAAQLGDLLGQNVVVQNLPSGAGVVAMTTVARARPDGLTLLSGITGLLLGPMLDATLPFELFRDFTPVSQLHFAATALVVQPALVAATTLAEFLALARGPGQPFDVGNYGYGSVSHLHTELLNRRAGLALPAVPYQNGAMLVRDLLAGHVRCGFVDTGSAAEPLRDGSLRALAVSGPTRSPLLPDVPTFVELGGFAGFEPQIWQGLFLPVGAPPEILGLHGRAAVAAVRQPSVAQTFRTLGYSPVGSAPEDFTGMLRREAASWQRIVEETGIRIR